MLNKNLKILVGTLLSLFFLNFVFSYQASTEEEILKIEMEDKTQQHFENFLTGIIKINDSINPWHTNYTDKVMLEYNGVGGTEFGYKILNGGLLPNGFSTFTKKEREDYFVENFCKNSDYNINYSNYPNDEIILDYDLLRGTGISQNFVLVCSKNYNGRYSAYGGLYEMRKEVSVNTPGPSGFSYEEKFGGSYKYNVSFFSQGVHNFDGSKLFKYYVKEGGNTCSNNIFSYTNFLTYYETSSSNGQQVELNFSDGKKDILICYGIFDKYTNQLLYKTQRKTKFSVDDTKPEISVVEGNWEKDKRYGNDRHIKIKCSDRNLVKCEVSYGSNLFKGDVNNGESFVELTGNINGEREIRVSAIDEMDKTKVFSKILKLDKVSPTIKVSFEEKIENQKIESIIVKVMCEDNLSSCQKFEKSGWKDIDSDTYEKEYKSNGEETLIFKDVVGNSKTQKIKIFNIGKSMANWYGKPYSSDEYKTITVASNGVTSCRKGDETIDVTSYRPCSKKGPYNRCSEFQADISPEDKNFYEVYDGGHKYKAGHRLLTDPTPPDGKIFCKYYDGVRPDFDVTTDKVLKATDSVLEYKFDGLTEEGGSGIKKINIEAKFEDGTIDNFQKTISSSDEEEKLKNSEVGIYLGYNDFSDISDFDNDSDGFGTIELNITVSDRAGNKNTKTDYLYIVPGKVNIEKSFSVSQNGDKKDGNLLADGDSYYKYDINLEDKFGNKIKDFEIPSISYERRVSSNNGIFFINTTDFYNEENYNPIYYKKPGSSSRDNNENNKIDVSEFNLNDGFGFKVKSLVPTKESGYSFGRGDINIQKFEIQDNKFNNIDFADNERFSEKLSFWPAFEIKVKSFTDNIKDNTNYDLNLKFIKNTSKNISFNPEEIKFEFKYEKKGDLLKRFKIAGKDKYNNDGIFSFDITPLLSSGEKKYTVNVDSNGDGFGESFIKLYLKYDNTKFNDYHTAYQTTRYKIGEEEYKQRDINIKGNISSKSSEGLGLIKDEQKNVFIDNKGFKKGELKGKIKKNIYKYTKNITNLASSDSTHDLKIGETSPSTVLENGEKIYYYDFRGKECESFNSFNDYNKGCVVRVKSSDGITKISGKINIIINGGNLLLDDNMYYANQKSLIGYFVLRDPNKMKNGGNIYITSKPTNLIGIAYAEGSLMSVDSETPDKIFINANTSPTELNKQLLWYGSVFSSNTVGGSVNYKNLDKKIFACPYGTDIYIAKDGDPNQCTFDEANKYDLATLRRFSSTAGDVDDCEGSYYGENGNGEKVENAFVGRKTCFDGNGNENLMKIDNHTSSFILKYDPSINMNTLKIISSQ